MTRIARALANNTKVFWGEKLPSVYAGVAGLLHGEAFSRPSASLLHGSEELRAELPRLQAQSERTAVAESNASLAAERDEQHAERRDGEPRGFGVMHATR